MMKFKHVLLICLVLPLTIFLLTKNISANNQKFHPPLDPVDSLTINQTYHTDHGNRAIDFKADANTHVFAVGDGEISVITPNHGRYVRLDLFDSDIVVYYVHVDPISNIKVGDTVEKGQQIGIISPHYNPPHLHLGLAWKSETRSKYPSGATNDYPNLMNYLPVNLNYKPNCQDVLDAWFEDWSTINWNKVASNSISSENWGYNDLSYLNNGNTSPTCIVEKPGEPIGTTEGYPGVSYTYTIDGSSCSLGHHIQYRFDWGDGTYSNWTSYPVNQTKTWDSGGTYSVRAQARCLENNDIPSSWSTELVVKMLIEVELIANNKEGVSGSRVTTEISIKNALGMEGGQFDLIYNPAILKPVSLNRGSFVPRKEGSETKDFGSNLEYKEDTIRVLWLTSLDSELDAGVVCTIEWELLTAGQSDLVFENILFSPTHYIGTSKPGKINVIKSSNADLLSITVSKGTLTPDFKPATKNYTLEVEHDVAVIDVKATLADNRASLTIDGKAAESNISSKVELKAAGTETVIGIVVTAEDQSTNTYTITVNRAKTPDPTETVSAEPDEEGRAAVEFPELQVDIVVESEEGGTIQVTRHTEDTKSPPTEMSPAEIYLTIEPSESLQGKPSTITVNYTLPLPEGVDERMLKLYRWSGSEWTLLPNQRVDPEAKTIQAEVEGFSLFGVFGTTEPPFTLGDVNDDGIINVQDVVLAMRKSLDLIELNNMQQKLSADVNGDGVVSVSDVVLIMRYSLGLIQTF